ncbi:MAG: hypothetical protein WCO02_07940 [Bacteroidota bacterium]
MSFLRIAFLLILLAKPVFYTTRPSFPVECDEVLTYGANHGLASVEKYINPLSLLYLDTSYAGYISDLEFRSGFLTNHPDSLGKFVLEIPEYTIAIASSTNSQHAASNLFRYYCSVPRAGGIDTIIRMYQQLYKILPVFIAKKPYEAILEKRLLSDFNYWYALALKRKAVKYSDPSVEYDRFLNLKPLNSPTDARLVTLMLALALQQLQSAAVNDTFIRKLREMQSTLNNKRFILPVLGNSGDLYTSPIESQAFLTSKKYLNIKDFLGNSAEVSLLVSSWLKIQNKGDRIAFIQGRCLVKGRDKAYLEVYYDFGMQALRLTMREDSMIQVEKIMEAID